MVRAVHGTKVPDGKVAHVYAARARKEWKTVLISIRSDQVDGLRNRTTQKLKYRLPPHVFPKSLHFSLACHTLRNARECKGWPHTAFSRPPTQQMHFHDLFFRSSCLYACIRIWKMFHRVSGTAIRFVTAALVLTTIVNLYTQTTSIELLSSELSTFLRQFLGQTDGVPILDNAGVEKSQQSATIKHFWVDLEHALRKSKPPVNNLSPSRPHIEQSFNEVWPNIIYEDLITINARDRKSLKDTHARFVSHLDELAQKLPYTSKSKGIVTTAGVKYINALLVSLGILRGVGSKLPVEVFFDARSETTDRVCAQNGILHTLKATCHFFSDFWIATPDAAYLKSYQLKIFALLFSSFEDILFLDADAFPAHNPDTLLHTEPTKSAGLVTWPDFWTSTTSSVFWDVAGVDEDGARREQDARASTESGVLLVSKKSHAATLVLAAYYNYFGPGCYYPLLSQDAQGEG